MDRGAGNLRRLHIDTLRPVLLSVRLARLLQLLQGFLARLLRKAGHLLGSIVRVTGQGLDELVVLMNLLLVVLHLLQFQVDRASRIYVGYRIRESVKFDT